MQSHHHSRVRVSLNPIRSVEAAKRVDPTLSSEREGPYDRLVTVDISHDRLPPRDRNGRRVHSPLNDRCAPGETSTESHECEVGANGYLAHLDGLAKRDRNRRRRGIPVTMNVGKDFLRWNLERLGRGLDDANVRLMGDKQIDVVDRQTSSLNRLLSSLCDRLDGEPIDLAPLHLVELLSVLDVLDRDWRATAASGHVKRSDAGTIGAENTGAQTRGTV